MKIHFYGSESARLFSKEAEVSLDHVIRDLLITDPENENVGFLSVSLPYYCWERTMWTRDAGTFLRELVLWDKIPEARLLTKALIRQVALNEDGFYAYPEYFTPGKTASGHELDGTAAILIGFLFFADRLPKEDETRREIESFLLQPASPLRYILSRLASFPLIAGSGEFGGGCGVPGKHINVIQNSLIREMLLFVSRHFAADEPHVAEECRTAASRLKDAIETYLIDGNGELIFCIDPQTLQPDPAILGERVNRGTGLLNGVLTMSADSEGLCPKEDGFFLYDASCRTFDRLFAESEHQKMFERYGMFLQFDDWIPGFTGPSYGHGYALQAMLLRDRFDLAAKALDFLAQATYTPYVTQDLKRNSRFEFYERYYTPYTLEMGDFPGAGCGPLNVVCVAEPLKVARLMAGIDSAKVGELVWVPRLPDNLSGFRVKDAFLPLGNGEGTYIDLTARKTKKGLHLTCKADKPIPLITVRVGEKKHAVHQADVLDIVI